MLTERHAKYKPNLPYRASDKMVNDFPKLCSSFSGKKNFVLLAISLFIIIGTTANSSSPRQPESLSDKQLPAPAPKTEEKREGHGGPPKEMAVGLAAGVKMEFLLVPAGEFTMGSVYLGKDHPGEGPLHQVKISKPFYLGKYQVTCSQFAAFVRDSGYKTDAEKEGWAYIYVAESAWKQVKGASWQNPGFSQDGNYPVTCVTWNDADAFCKWLSRKQGKKYRLPTEAEWEYACRAGTTTQFYYGDDPNDTHLTDYIWCDKNSNLKTHPVGQKKPNAFGLYDIGGNTMVWCNDWYDEDYYWSSPATDPQGPSTGRYRAARGGSWWSPPLKCSSSFRNRRVPNYRSNSLSFRVVSDF